MLTPHELFTAQGFPSDYVIEGMWKEQATNGLGTLPPKRCR
ncbi:hypothetical protein [Ruegeria sp. SCP11]